MSDKAPAFAFTLNIPVACNIRFVDVRPGKMWNDPKKGMIQLPPQVSLKGSFDGVETIAFLKGKVWANVKALVEAGVVDPEWASRTDELEATQEIVSLPVTRNTVTATYAKGPMDKYANMVFTAPGQAAPPAPKRLTAAEAAAARPHKGPIMPFDEDPFDPGPDEPWDNPAERHPDAPPVVQKSRQAAPTGSLVEEEYLALWSRVAERQVSVGKALGMPVDGSSVNAATFAIAKKLGIV